jgi:hypothetical protein
MKIQNESCPSTDKLGERRSEQRLHYYWPIWFTKDLDNGTLSQGQMLDVSSRGAAFTCHDDGSCPCPGQEVTARFSVPQYGPEESFDMANFTRSGNVCRVEEVNNFVRKVAIQFAEPLSFRPGEQSALSLADEGGQAFL